jgi:predicted permease
MTPLRRIWFFVTRWRRIRDLDEEMRLHIELRAAANRRRGVAPDEAARQARVRFGNPLTLREEAREMWGWIALERAGHDLRDAVRQVLRRPIWTVVVVSTLALGVGASTSVFTLIDAMLFRPAPWNEDGRLVWIASTNSRTNRVGPMSYSEYLEYRDRARTLTGVLAWTGNAVAVGGAHAELANAGLVSGNYFEVLRLRAQIGRTFAPEEDATGASPVVVLSDALWRRHFGADPHVVGRVVAINGEPATIVGVAPRGFTGVAYADNPEELWMPLAMVRLAIPHGPGLLTGPNALGIRIVGRLGDGETVAHAAAEMRVIAAPLDPGGTPSDRARGVRVMPVRGGMTPWEQNDFGGIFGLIAIVPVLMLLVACTNVANVLMARNMSRRRELAVREAIGASRGRLVRLLLMESVVLAILSAAAGFAASFALNAVIVHYGEVPAEVSALVAPDRRALLAAMIVAIFTTLFFGVAPALTATRFEVHPTLKDEGTTSTAASGRTRLRRIFVVAQVALSLTLLIVAGLFLQSLERAIQVDPGFESHGLASVSFDTNLLGYTPARRNAYVTEFVRRASSLSGVVSVATADILPLGGEMYEATISGENAGTPARATTASVSPGYFTTMRLPLVRGREFTQADADADAPVAIVNETLAHRLWPGVDALGKRVRTADSNAPWREVIGVAHDAKYMRLTEPARAAYYVPLGPGAAAAGSLVVRTTGEPRAILPGLTNIAQDLDANLPLIRIETMDEQLHRTVNLQRAVASLLGVLGALTLLLASVGVYGVAAHSVSLRTREVGIRMSFGARATDVSRMILRENLSLALVGVAMGVGISLAGSKLLASFLFGLTSTDPLTLVVASAILCLVTLAASSIPAHRAAHLDPLIALRHE